jgi:hypothetical protein
MTAQTQAYYERQARLAEAYASQQRLKSDHAGFIMGSRDAKAFRAQARGAV